MKQGYYFLYFLFALSAIISSYCCCASNNDLFPKRAYEENPSSSSDSSSVSEHDSLTPIEDTDSAPSDHGRIFSPGSPRFHEKMYGFHHAKVKYHQVFGDAYNQRHYKQEAEEHYAESNSSKKKKLKHRKLYKGLLEENLKPGVKTAKKDAVKKKDFPKAPTRREALEKIKDSHPDFERRKGHHYLVEKKPVVQKGRLSASEKGKGIAIDPVHAPVHDQKTTANKEVTHTYTLTPIYAQRQTARKPVIHTTTPAPTTTTEKKQVKEQAVHTSVPPTTSPPRSPVKQDSTKDLITFPTQDYYRSRSSHKVGKRLPVRKLGGGKSNSPSASDHSSEGNYSGDSLKEPLLKGGKH